MFPAEYPELNFLWVFKDCHSDIVPDAEPL